MVQINGKYAFESSEKFYEYLIAMGLPEDKAKEHAAQKPEYDIKVEGKKIEMTTVADSKKHTFSLKDGEEVDEVMPNNVTLKSKAEVKGDTITVTSKTPFNTTEVRTYKFTSSGMTLVMTSSKAGTPECKRMFKRL